MEHEDLVDLEFVNAKPDQRRFWINAADAVYWVDFATSPAIEAGLQNDNPIYWKAILDYAHDKIADHRAAEELANLSGQ